MKLTKAQKLALAFGFAVGLLFWALYWALERARPRGW